MELDTPPTISMTGKTLKLLEVSWLEQVWGNSIFWDPTYEKTTFSRLALVHNLMEDKWKLFQMELKDVWNPLTPIWQVGFLLDQDLKFHKG